MNPGMAFPGLAEGGSAVWAAREISRASSCAALNISHDGGNELPLLLSDNGYGILVATNKPVICCDISVYGSYLCAEDEQQLDYYFIGGKKQVTIMNAYAYLCGRL